MKTTFIAAGDSFITRRIPEAGYPGFNELKALVESHDVRFVNLESTFHDQEGYPAATRSSATRSSRRSSATTASRSPTTKSRSKVHAYASPIWGGCACASLCASKTPKCSP